MLTELYIEALLAQMSLAERPLYPIAVIQVARINLFSMAAFGQKQTSGWMSSYRLAAFLAA